MKQIASLIAVVAILGCATESAPPETAANPGTSSPPAIDQSESDKTGESNTGDVFVIDVRSQSEWDSGHVDQAVLIPHTEITGRISEVTTDKSAKIVLYCAVGGRAGKAKAALEELGYTDVENGGGYDDVRDRF